MERDPSQTLYTVALTGVRDKASQMKVAETLSSVSGRLPMESVMKRLDALPWTLTRKASYKRAYRLAKLLEGLGGQVRCIPPLPAAAKPPMDETMILPGAGLLSQTQVMSATQFISRPDERSSLPSAPGVTAVQTDRGTQDAFDRREPSLNEVPPEQPLEQETGTRAKVGFLKRHLVTLVVGIMALAVTAAGLALTLYILALYMR